MPQPIVQTRSGKVEGRTADGVTSWLGIPYARADRFAPPEPAEPWDGVRPAYRFGKQCSQQIGPKVRPELLERRDYGEDCLFLNVWAPDSGTADLKPVMVWIHGGAFMTGSANPYDASALVREGEIVVVTINYRLGILGFVNFGDALGLPSLPSNLGLRDQIAALEWVRDNIAGFGGDPGRVTICGESAGSTCVALLMLSLGARGLFHGAIMQSGAVSLIHDRESSIANARRLAQLLDLDQGGLERLKSMDLATLMEAQAAHGNEIRNTIPAAPWYDDDLLPASLEEARRHQAAPLPLMAGTTRDEIRLFELMPGDILPTKWPDLEALLFGQLDEAHARRILAAYPRTAKGRRALATDLTFAIPARNFAERHSRIQPTWFYRFDYAHPIAGAAHGLDLTLFWPFNGLKMALVRGGPNLGRRAELGRRMRRHAASFVKSGTPGEDWSAYETGQRMVRLYNLDDMMIGNPNAERYAAWAGRDVAPRMSP